MKRILFVLGFAFISSQATSQTYMLVVEDFDKDSHLSLDGWGKKLTILDPNGKVEKTVFLSEYKADMHLMSGDKYYRGKLDRWKRIQKELIFITNKGYKLIDFEVQGKSYSKSFSGVWFFDKVK